MKQLARALSDMFNATVGYVDKDGNRQKTSPIVKFNIEVTDTWKYRRLHPVAPSCAVQSVSPGGQESAVLPWTMVIQ